MSTTTDGQVQNSSARQSLLKLMYARQSGILKRPVVLCIWICLTMVSVVAEPFGTTKLFPFWPRLLFWWVLIGTSVLFGNAADAISERRITSGNQVYVSALSIGLMTITFSPVVFLWCQLFALKFHEISVTLALIYYYVFVSSSAVFVLLAAIRPQMTQPETTSSVAGAVPFPEGIRPRLCLRLEQSEACILRLSARNHRIEVVTKEGVEHIRMRFADAVAEMDLLPGSCVHRSHWVALWAVDRLKRRKNKIYVVLCNGDEIPVSRTYRPRLEEAMPELF